MLDFSPNTLAPLEEEQFGSDSGGGDGDGRSGGLLQPLKGQHQQPGTSGGIVSGTSTKKSNNKRRKNNEVEESAKEAKKVDAVKVDNDDVRYWKVTLDSNTFKPYYYNRMTKEVSWVKPLGFDESGIESRGKDASGTNNETEVSIGPSVAENQKKTRFRPFKDENAKEMKVEKSVEETVEDGNPIAGKTVAEEKNPIAENHTVTAKVEENGNDDHTAKYWRASLDAATGKTCYYNKKTKVVTWTKPPGAG